MIKGKLRISLSIDTVLERTSPFEIFKYYIPGDWKINEIMCSPLRNDKNPSFLIGNKYGELNFKDFAIDEHKGDCFKFVKILYNLPNLDTVLKVIDRDLNLGISEGSTVRTSIIKPIIKNEGVTKRNTLIQVITRKFNEKELLYWKCFLQEEKDLIENNIYSIKKIFINKKPFPIKDDELRFGYFYPDKGWKLYFPEREKRKKWLSNIPLTLSYGLNNLNKEHNTLICKSLKDYLVAKKIYPYVCHVQNESLSAFSEENIVYINNNSKTVFCSFDSDSPGKKASWEVTTKYNWKHINPPDRLLPEVKDLADWACKEGLETVKQHFIDKKLIT